MPSIERGLHQLREDRVVGGALSDDLREKIGVRTSTGTPETLTPTRISNTHLRQLYRYRYSPEPVGELAQPEHAVDGRGLAAGRVLAVGVHVGQHLSELMYRMKMNMRTNEKTRIRIRIRIKLKMSVQAALLDDPGHASTTRSLHSRYEQVTCVSAR